jgi:multiple sugar transport system substrate-binding protein
MGRRSARVRSWTGALLVAALLVTAAGCGGGGGGGGGSQGKVDPNAAVSGTVNFPSFFWREPGHKWLLEQTKRFASVHQGAKVEGAFIPFSDYHKKVYTDMVSGQAPDLTEPYDPEIRQWAKAGLLEPLDDYLKDAGIDVNKLLKPQQIAIVDGRVYGLLWYSNPRVLVYNKKILDDAGLQPPANLEELNAAIGRLRDESKQQFGFATLTGSDSPNSTYLDIMPIIAGFGGAFVRDGKPTANSPETVAALRFIEDNVTKGLIPRSTTQQAYRDAFMQGKVGMIAIGPFMVNTTKETNPAVGATLSTRTVPLPASSNIAVNVFLAVPKKAKNKAGAIRFLLDSLDPQVQANAADQINGVPATGEVAPDFLAKNPWFQAPVDAAKTAVSYAPSGAEDKMPQVLKIVTDNYQAMLSTDVTAQQAADKMQQQLEQLVGS